MKVQELINLLQKFDVNHTVRLKVKGEFKNIDVVTIGRFINTVELAVFDDISIEQAEGETMTGLLAGNEISEDRMRLITRSIGQERFDEIRNEINAFRQKQAEENEEILKALEEVPNFEESFEDEDAEKLEAAEIVKRLYEGEDLDDEELEALPKAKKILGRKAVAAIKKAAESAE